MSSSGKGLRRDAQQNRDRLISAARAVFSERGADVPLHEIARLAGVGRATLYRRFPTRDALNEALFGDLADSMLRIGEQALTESDGWTALEVCLEGMCAHVFSDRAASDLFKWATATQPQGLTVLSDRLGEIFRLLVRRAQDQGSVRADVEPEDVRMLTSLIRELVSVSTDLKMDGAWRRTLRIMLDGLRTQHDVLPARAPSPAEYFTLVRELSRR